METRTPDKQTSDKVSFITFIISRFAATYRMNIQEAYFFLEKYGGPDYLMEYVGGHSTPTTIFGQYTISIKYVTLMEGRADEDESLPRQFTTTDTFYASETSTRLAEEATGYYRKPWQEIYEMLRAKLKIYNTAPGLSCSDQSHEHHRQGAGKDQKCPNLKHLSGEKQDKNEKMD